MASFGRRCLVEDTGDPPRKRHRCVPRGRGLRIVCGDHVRWQRAAAGARDGQVLAIEPRRNALERPNLRGFNEVLAANVTRLVVVVAPAPAPDPFMVDRYLAQAELMGCEALIVRSKGDLPSLDDDEDLLEQAFAEWRDAGYDTLRVAISAPDTIEALAHALRQDTSILVGQSGVGKSSLLNALVPDLDLATGELSESSGEGRHTTTAAHLHHLPDGGQVIDSPGVRDYAPGRVGEAEVAKGFRDIRALAEGCRFHNCLHMQEPDCAVRAALAGDGPGTLAPRRYESYRRLVRLMETLGRGHH
ncbi:MAG: ribosome small subunit-dependent GTPase A [Pseudomonadota bacterium]